MDDDVSHEWLWKAGRLASCAFVAFVSMATTVDAQQPKVRGFIELFTSQGCSSCPPADELLGKLATDPSLIAITLPVDYWDYLGWKDTLAKPEHAARQRAYAVMRGDREVYTPQVVVNGLSQVLGSDHVAIERALAQTRHLGTLTVPVKLALSGNRLTVSLPSARDELAHGEIWLCALAKRIPVAIGRGENRGRTVVYHNVVRRWLKLGEWAGSTRSFMISAGELASGGIDEAAVLVQAGSSASPGPVLGAAAISLR